MDDAPLFPATLMTLGRDGLFAAEGLKREYWGNADPIRRLFREAFGAVGLP